MFLKTIVVIAVNLLLNAQNVNGAPPNTYDVKSFVLEITLALLPFGPKHNSTEYCCFTAEIDKRVVLTQASIAQCSTTTKIANEQQKAQFREDYMWANAFSTYYKLHDIAQPWNKARQICQAEGTELLVPTSIDEMENLKILMSNMKAYYTAIFIGLHDQFSKGQFVNLRGEKIDFTFLNLLWAEGRPDNKGGNEHCVVMTREGLFDDEPCDKHHPFMCKIFANQTRQNKPCKINDMGYVLSSNGKCYKFHVDPLSWHDAYMVCKAEQGQLAIINSPEEANLVTSFLGQHLNSKAQDPNILLIGFSDLMFPYQYRTITGESLEKAGYYNWDSEKKIDREKKSYQNCGVISRTGYLDMTDCNVPAMFLCEHLVTNGTQATVARSSKKKYLKNNFN